jgi:hypothetical protein
MLNSNLGINIVGKLQKNQKGFTLVEGLLVVIALALVVGVGFYVMNANKDKKDDTVTSTSQTVKKTKPAVDPTLDWTSYSSPLGKFSLKYPKSWATATNPDLCTNTTETGIFMLGADSSSVGKCASEGFGQMTITWRTDRQICGDLNSDTTTQDSKQTVTVGGQSATKIETTAKAPGMGLGADPEGTKSVQYCVVANDATYIANYTQLSSYPDALNDFNTMVTKTLKFN